MKTASLGTARSLLAPLRVGFWRAAGEALLGWFALVVVASAIQPGISTILFFRPTVHTFSAFLAFLGWAWVVLWPVWRLRRAVGAHVWTRLPKGFLRIGLLAAVVGLACVGVGGISEIWPGDVAAIRSQDLSEVLSFSLAMWFFRLWVDVAAGLRRWARTKLRRQLAISYMFVIMTTFLGALGIASFAIGFGVAADLPGPVSQSRAISEMLESGSDGSSINAGQAQVLLQGIATGSVRPVSYGGSPLNLLIPWRLVNRRIEVVDARGTLLAAATIDQGKGSCIVGSPGQILSQSGRRALIDAALRSSSGTAQAPLPSSCNSEGVVELAASALVMGAEGRPIAAVLVWGETLAPSWIQIVRALIVVFTVASVLLVSIAVLPILALSFLAAMFFARGLTRGLSSVAEAAASLSDGDLSQRVPVTARNEIGALAKDFNRMASRLGQTMDELRAARSEAEQALRAKQELVASVSHELRTPIAIVQAHLEAIDDACAAGEGAVPAATLQAARREMERLTDLVNDLFTLARAGTDALKVQCVPTDVGAIVREVAASLGPLAQREGSLMLTANSQLGLPPALVDGDRLRQILANLVRNAVRHTPEGGIIALDARVEDQWLVLSVADTGEGISADHLPHIFERFYRVDKARTRASGGAGLGLAIVKEFVELMGGHVSVESTMGEGTCFHVYLPGATTPPGTARNA